MLLGNNGKMAYCCYVTCNLLTPKTAGIESAANTKSLSSIHVRQSNNGVAFLIPFSTVKNFSPSNFDVLWGNRMHEGYYFRGRQVNVHANSFSGCSCIVTLRKYRQILNIWLFSRSSSCPPFPLSSLKLQNIRIPLNSRTTPLHIESRQQ